MTEPIELTLRLPTEQIEMMQRIAQDAGTTTDVVFNVILALYLEGKKK
jgi:hypothetical protein